MRNFNISDFEKEIQNAGLPPSVKDPIINISATLCISCYDVLYAVVRVVNDKHSMDCLKNLKV